MVKVVELNPRLIGRSCDSVIGLGGVQAVQVAAPGPSVIGTL